MAKERLYTKGTRRRDICQMINDERMDETRCFLHKNEKFIVNVNFNFFILTFDEFFI